MAAVGLGGRERMESIDSSWLLIFINQKEVRNRTHGAGEMANRLGTPSFLAVDPRSIPSTHTAAHRSLKLHFQGIWHLLWPPHTAGMLTYMQAKHSHIHVK